MSDLRIPAESFTIGEYIQDELDERGWTLDRLADRAGLTLDHVNRLLIQRHGITPQEAEALGRAFGTSAKLWYALGLIYEQEA